MLEKVKFAPGQRVMMVKTGLDLAMPGYVHGYYEPLHTSPFYVVNDDMGRAHHKYPNEIEAV